MIKRPQFGEESKRCALFGRAGATLIEVLFTTLLVSAIVLAMSLFISKATGAFLSATTKRFATNTANSKISALKATPYALVPPTPAGPAMGSSGAYFLNTTCDCTNVDSTQLPGAQVVSDGKTTFTETVCTSLVTPTAGGGWASQCPSTVSGSDPGLKNVMVNMMWNINGTTHTVSVGSLISQNAQHKRSDAPVGYVQVILCQQDVAQTPNNCLNVGGSDPTGTNNPALLGDLTSPNTPTDISVYKQATGVLIDNGGVLPLPTTISLALPPDTGYSLQIQKNGFFPFHRDANVDVVTNSTNPVHVYLRAISDYGSKLSGEVYYADHPVISKVISGIAQPNGGCTVVPGSDNATEAVELYNPTQSTYTFGTGGNISLQFCNIKTCLAPFTFSELHSDGSPKFTVRNKILYPGSFMLIVGKDFRAAPSGVPDMLVQWNVNPDVLYDVGDAELQFP